MYTEIRFTLNGEQKLYQGDPLRRLLDVLREDYGLTGSKEGCGEGECGACSIIKNGELVTSCIIPVIGVSQIPSKSSPFFFRVAILPVLTCE